MKIIYCILGTYNSGGMERVLSNKANYLVKNGYDVHIVTTDQQGRKPYYSLDERIRQTDLEINYTDSAKLGLFRKIKAHQRKQKLHRKRLTHLLLTERADIVISMFDPEVSFLYKINDGSKKILEIHFSRYKRIQYGRGGLWKFVDVFRTIQDAFLAKKYDRFVVLTQEDKGYWKTVPHTIVIPNANTFFPPDVAKLDNKCVIAVGRFDRQKAFDHLIAAWLKVYVTFPDWTLQIFGDGPDREYYEKQIRALELQTAVYLRKPTSHIEKEYLSSSFIAMSSRYEGLPMALLEAQACGLPIVSYACKCGPRDIIEDGLNGILVDEGDILGLANSMLQLIRDEPLRKEMGQASRDMSTRFSEDYIMKKWMDLFQELRTDK